MQKIAGKWCWLLAVVSIIFTSCKEEESGQFIVEGTFKHAAGQKVMLAELPYASPNRIVVDSTTTDSLGHFKLQSVQSQENLYQLFVVNGPGILIINDAPLISIEADVDAPEGYTTKGSPASASIKNLYSQFMPAYQLAADAKTAAGKVEHDRSAGDSLRSAVLLHRDQSQRNLNELLINYLQTEKNGTALYFAMGMARQFLPGSEWEEHLTKLLALHPKHPGLTLLKVSAAVNKEQGIHLLNKPVPELALNDTSGKPVPLSSFRGKWVLVDCWASWCAPCRKENPNIVAAWRKYNKRNFTVLGVSLDKDKTAWLQAIEKDTLTWKQVSDLKYWDSEAVKTYDIQSLPFNMLVDPKGNVNAINLTDSVLHLTLKKVLK